MNQQIRRLAVALMVCYVALFGMLNYWQVFAADRINRHPSNVRPIINAFNQPRGSIETADGVLLAESVEVSGGEFDYQRVYPEGQLYGQITGWFSLNLGSAGLESEYNSELAGQTSALSFQGFNDLLVDRDPTGDLLLSINHDVQRIAADALGDQEGAVVALDPRTGEVIALVSYPTYDPNFLSSHDTDAAALVRRALDDVPGSPLLSTAFQERDFPGSTFKIVTAAAGLDEGVLTETEPDFPVVTSYTPPLTTNPIDNFGGSLCGGTLFDVLADSCNSAFAELSAEMVGAEPMIGTAESFGFNDRVPIDLPGSVESAFPTNFDQDAPALAQAGIGQNSVQASPLHMALVAAAVANSGQMMTPSVVSQIRDSQGDIVDRNEPQVWREPLSEEDADVLRRAMIGVVENGTARDLAIPGMIVGGKTGTAETGSSTDDTHAWIIGFAGPPGERAQVAIAVFLKAQPGQGQRTGSGFAAPIGRIVLEAALRVALSDTDLDLSPESSVPPTSASTTTAPLLPPPTETTVTPTTSVSAPTTTQQTAPTTSTATTAGTTSTTTSIAPTTAPPAATSIPDTAP